MRFFVSLLLITAQYGVVQTGVSEQNQTITDLTGELEKLKAIYDEDLTVVEEQISSNTGDFQLTKDVISRLTEEVKRIRASLIS